MPFLLFHSSNFFESQHVTIFFYLVLLLGVFQSRTSLVDALLPTEQCVARPGYYAPTINHLTYIHTSVNLGILCLTS